MTLCKAFPWPSDAPELEPELLRMALRACILCESSLPLLSPPRTPPPCPSHIPQPHRPQIPPLCPHYTLHVPHWPAVPLNYNRLPTKPEIPEGWGRLCLMLPLSAQSRCSAPICGTGDKLPHQFIMTSCQCEQRALRLLLFYFIAEL